MSLNFDEYDTDVPEKIITTNTSKVTSGIRAPGSEDKTILAGSGINPQSSSGLGINPQTINQVWNDVKPYVDPIHYKDDSSKDYQNIDFPTSIAHGVGDVMAAYGLKKTVGSVAGQMFPEPGVAVQRDQMNFQRSEAKRLARGELNPIERSRLALEDAKRQQILAGLNPTPQTPQAPTAPTATVPTAPLQTPPQAPTGVSTQLVVPTAPPVAPTVQQRTIDPMLSPEIQQSTGLTGLTKLEEQTGGPITTGTDLKMIQQSEFNRLAKEQEALAKAQAAGVTPSTSPPEAQTLVASREAALDLGEKAQEKVSVTEPTKKVKGAVAPRTLNEIAQQPNLSSTFQQHLVNQQKIIQNNPKYEEALAKAYESGKIPKGYVFVPGVGNMDNNVFNTLGPEGRREALEAKGLTAFGQVPEPKNMKYNDVVSKNIADYAQHLRDTIPSVELNTRQERIAKGEPHSTNYGRLVGGPNKEGKLLHTPMKIAGFGGGLMAISSLSQAKSIPEFIARGVDVGTDYLPLVGQIKQGLTPSEAGAPTLPPSAYTESRKLGSPFYKMFKEGAAPPSMR